MAFFGSNGYERKLGRSYSVARRDRPAGARAAPSNTQQPNPNGADEFGFVVSEGRGTEKDGADAPSPSRHQQQQQKNSSAFASSSLNPSDTAAGPSNASNVSTSPSASRKQNQHVSETRTSATKPGSRQGSSPNPSSSNSGRKRTSSNGLKPPTPEGRSGSPSDGNGDTHLRARSSPDLKERERYRVRAKSSPSREDSAENYRNEGEIPMQVARSTSASSFGKVPRGPRPLVRSESRQSHAASSSLSPVPSATWVNGGLHSASGSFSIPPSPSPLNELDEEKSPQNRKASDAVPSPAPSRTLNDEVSLTPAQIHISTKRSNHGKATCGNVSDSSYGSPLSELGAVGGFSVKSLLARPAASTLPSANGIRSEPDIIHGSTSTSRRHLRAGGISPFLPPASPSVYSMGSMVDQNSITLDMHAKKATLSDPEHSNGTFGSLGRSRGLEWGHILSRHKDGNHTREQSASFSVSSPSEGNPFPYGPPIAREREREGSHGNRGLATVGNRPIVQLTTNAVRRLSALGGREGDRSRAGTGSAPLTYVPHSQGAARLSPALVKQNASSGSGSSESQSRSQRNRAQNMKAGEGVSVSRREDSPPPVGLTPAELIMHAYKQQERRRRELEKGATGDVEKLMKQTTSRGKDKHSKKEKAEMDEDGAVGPYYTVFGDSTGKVVTIGRVRDSAFGLFESGNDTKAKATERAVVAEMNTPGPQTSTFVDISFDGPHSGLQEDRQTSLRRKLSKKMSGTGKVRDGSISQRPMETPDDIVFSSSDDAPRPRPSLSLSAVTGKRPDLERVANASKGVKNSLDSFVNVAVPDADSGKALPSASNGPTTKAGKINERSASEGDKDKGRIWGFVKRISSNTLKDKYKRNSAEVVPPVPVLPREHTSEIDRENSPMSLLSEREKKPKRSTHGRRPSTAPVLSSAGNGGLGEGRFATLRKKPSLAQVAQIVLGPRSSSPSSDNASSVKFRHSGESSASSINEANAKPGSKSPLIQHILPPETLHMLEEYNAQFPSSNDGHSDAKPAQAKTGSLFYGFSGSEISSHQALPAPPRRPALATPASSRSESPTIPTFCADNAINTFGPRNRATTVDSTFTGADFGTSSVSKLDAPVQAQGKPPPPPRPPRSSRRGPSASAVLQSCQSQSSGSSNSSSPAPASGSRGSVDPRTSMSAQSTASTCRPIDSPHYSQSQSRSSSTSPSPPPELLDGLSPISASDSASSAVTFRDIAAFASGTKAMLSEKEKVDKWNDLLDRSDRAGGTLHVGLGGLLSDTLRDSALEPIRDDFSFVDY